LWVLRASVALLALIAGIVVLAHLFSLSPQDRPFAKLNLEDPVGAFTATRLAALRGDNDRCRRLIALSKLETTDIPDVEERGFCRLQNALTLERSVHPYSQPTRISCPLAAALYVWEREIVAPAAREHLQAEIARIEILGTYSCRRIYGRRAGPVSFHATGEAIDVSGFRLEDGRVISVLDYWGSKGREGSFLRAVRNGGCRVFRAVLSPDYNAAHANHFHFDMGDYSLCE